VGLVSVFAQGMQKSTGTLIDECGHDDCLHDDIEVSEIEIDTECTHEDCDHDILDYETRKNFSIDAGTEIAVIRDIYRITATQGETYFSVIADSKTEALEAAARSTELEFSGTHYALEWEYDEETDSMIPIQTVVYVFGNYEDWEESQMCSIFITRKHVTGNVTLCIYLVDLGCLGVKDTDYKFNILYSDVEQMIKDAEEFLSIIEVPYELVHNIIYAGIEFADKYGFKPHKDFRTITSHFLEDDTEAIPLIDIECGGKDGKPIFIDDAFDEEDDEEEEDFDEDMELFNEELAKEISNMDREKQKEMFMELFHREENGERLPDEEKVRLIILTNFLIYSLIDQNEVSEQLEKWEKKLNVGFVDEAELPNSLFIDVQSTDGEKLADLFYEAHSDITDSKNSKKSMAKLREETGEVPVIEFLELYELSRKGNSKKYAERMKEAYQKYPDYFMIQQYYLLAKGEDCNVKFLERLLTNQKQPVTFFEAEFFFSIFVMLFLHGTKADAATVLALELFYSTLDFLSDEANAWNLAAFTDYKYDIILKHFE